MSLVLQPVEDNTYKVTFDIQLVTDSELTNTTKTITINVEQVVDVKRVMFIKGSYTNPAAVLRSSLAEPVGKNADELWAFDVSENATYTVVVEGKDGNCGLAKVTINCIDKTAPSVTNIQFSPETPEGMQAGGTITVTWDNPPIPLDGSFDSPLAYIDITIDKIKDQERTSEKPARLQNGVYQYEFPNIDTSANCYEFSFVCVDELGNECAPVLEQYWINERQLKTEVLVEGSTVSKTVTNSSIFTGSSYDIASFYMFAHEVTQKEYVEIMGEGSNPSSNKTSERNPVEKVSWYDAIVYCNKLSTSKKYDRCYYFEDENGNKTYPEDMTVPRSNDSTWNNIICNVYANGYRLPTEVEWEYAARGGKDGIDGTQFTYAGSDDITDVAWYSGNSSGKTHEVMTKDANALGLYDMTGNVWEWTMSGTSNKTSRGGSYYVDTDKCELNSVYNERAYQNIYGSLGFRVVRTKTE